MVIDHRLYTLQVGAVASFMELFEKEGLEPQVRILGNFMGLFRTEIGNVNQILMMFAYADAVDRQRRRDQLYKDPAFKAFLVKARPLIRDQEVRLLVPSRCNPSFGPPASDSQAVRRSQSRSTVARVAFFLQSRSKATHWVSPAGS